MNLLLQSIDEFNRMAELHLATGVIRDTRRTEDSISGHFAERGGRRIALYRKSGELRFRFDHLDYAISQDVHFDLVRGLSNTLTLVRSGSPVFSWTYPPPAMVLPLEDLEEEEDYDFGLFVFNVVNSPTRRARIYR